MPLAAGMYRGRVGDRAFFTGLGNIGVSPYAGAGPYAPEAGLSAVRARRQVRLGATPAAQLRPYWQQAYPEGMSLAGITMGAAPIPHKRVTLPSGRTIVIY